MFLQLYSEWTFTPGNCAPDSAPATASTAAYVLWFKLVSPPNGVCFINQCYTHGTTGTHISDFDRNGAVNSTDVSSFISAWYVPCP